ncbi:fibronectin type III domain-containing protein [Archangium primigenium]|uniref:fibronectin type III domain-containing protein n=1 Tax=[Archangium] primigenium TaxID=2792470 RepID=UPI00195A1CBB|nr:fibronectin type III domain-containing protein [Archangium primigenium]MBM7117647.1 fibronectin type III domain-containing protein [Archangium primigenium]
MRTLTEAERAALSCRAGYSTWHRVLLFGPGNRWWDLGALPVGERATDFLEEATLDDSQDAPVAQLRVRLKRQVLLASLAPLMAESPLNNLGGAYEPLVRTGRLVVLEVALAPLGQQPHAVDWQELFRGRVDTPTDAGETLEFGARDYSGLLQDCFIEVERPYSSDAGTPVQAVMQQILSDNGQGAFGLYTPVDPEWAVGRYLQKKEPVLEALRALAGQLGADVRYRWSPVAQAFALTFAAPQREATEPVWHFLAEDYRALPDVEMPMDEVRNAVTGYFYDSLDRDAAGQPKLKRVDRDAGTASLQAYGRRWMEIVLAATDNIDTEPEMVRLLESAMSDLGQPPLGLSFEVACHPGLELGDVVALAPNGVQWSSTQTGAVVALTHTFTRDKATTKVVVRGKPSLAPRQWLQLETGRPGQAPAAPYTGPRPPTVVSASALPQGLAVSVAPATGGADTAEYEVHVSTTSGFAPDTSYPSSTLKEVGARTRFELQGLTPGRTYYVRMVARDAAGNRGAASPEVALSPSYLSPGALATLVSYGALPLNGDFEAQADPAGPPDGSYMLQGTWGVDAVVDTSTAFAGTRCVRLRASGTRLGLQAFVARPGERLALKAHAYSQVQAYAELQVVWLDRQLTPVGEPVTVWGDYLQANTWTTLGNYLTVPAGARVARLSVRAAGNYPDAFVWFDSVSAVPGVSLAVPWQRLRHPSLGGGGNVSDYLGNWKPNPVRPVRWRVNALGELELQGSLYDGQPGTEAFRLPGVAPAGYTSPADPARFVAAAGPTGRATVSVHSVGTDAAFVITVDNAYVVLDGVRYPLA